MNNTKHTFVLSALAAALLALYGPAMAADDPELAEIATPSSSISVGAGVWSDDRAQGGKFDGMADEGGYLLLDLDLVKRDDATGTWQTLTVRDMGLDTRELRAEYQQQGNQGVAIEYNRKVRGAPYTINTGVTGIGTDTQTVPSPSIVPGTGTNYRFSTEREKIGLDFFKYLTPSLNLKVNFTNEDKNGNRHWRVGGQPEFAALPVDWNMRFLDGSLNYTGDQLQLSGGYSGSWFENANDLLTVTRAGTPYYLSMPLDSQAHQAFLSGSYRFTPTTQGTFKLSYTHATQDEHLPTSDIPGLALPGGPSSLDGEINTTLVMLGLTSRPMPKLNVVANLRYHNVEDETPAWLVVDGDGNPATTADNVHSTPLSYETLSGKVEGNYNLAEGYNLIAGVDYSQQDRTVPVYDEERYVPFRADMDETTYRVQLRKSLSETLNGSLAFLHSKRDGSEYHHAHHSFGTINPINISDRDRNKWRFTMDWTPIERLGLQFNFEDSQDDYGSANEYGLSDGNARLFAVDADYAINDNWRLTAWLSHDDTEANQFNGRWDRTTEVLEVERRSNLKDTGNSVGFGIRGQASAKVKVGADLQWTRTKSQYNDTVIPAGLGDPDTGYPTGISPLDDIKNTMTRINLFVEYALKKNADLRVDLIHERWKTDDWTWQFSDGTPFTFGTSNDGTTIYTDPKQNSTFLGVRYSYKFQ